MYSGYNSRLAWCYGELNYVLMYFKLGDIFKSNQYSDMAKEILKNTVPRNNPEQAKVDSPYFCHGSSGLIALNTYFFRKTKENTYKEIANYWFQYTVSNFPLKELSTSVKSNPFSLLDGEAGIVMGLLSLIESNKEREEPIWEKFFLL
jgi:lantibiotic modifying enzyme